MSFRVTQTGTGTPVVLQCKGTLDRDGGEVLVQVVDELLPDIRQELILDCEGLHLVDSAGLGIIVALHHKLRRHNIELLLVKVQDRLIELLRITKLSTVLRATPIQDTADQEEELGGISTSMLGDFTTCWETINCQHKDCPNFGKMVYTCWNTPHAPCKKIISDDIGEEIAGCVSCPVYVHNVSHFASIQQHFEEYVRKAEQAFARLKGEKQELSEQVSQQRALLGAMVQQSPECIMATDANQNIILWNPAMVQLTGREQDEVKTLSEAARVIYPREDYIQEEFQQFIASGKLGINREFTITQRENLHRVHTWSSLIVRDPNGNPLGIFALGRDITAYRMAQEALSQSEKQHRYLTENISDGLALVIGGYVSHANPALHVILGWSPQALTDMKFADLFVPDRRESVERFMDPDENGTETVRYESIMLKQDGTPVQVEITQGASRYLDEPGWLVMIRDVSTRRRLLAYERLLPVCSSCGAVREEAGSWRSMEEFLKATVEKPITHTLCPCCATKVKHEVISFRHEEERRSAKP